MKFYDDLLLKNLNFIFVRNVPVFFVFNIFLMGQLFILIAEDDAADRHIALAALQKTNQFKKIVLVNNAQEAITYLSKADKLPDIILSDLMMPRYDGFDLFNKLKTDDRYSSIPFVIYTNDLSSPDIVKASELGIDVLEKPFDMNEYSNLCKMLSDLARNSSGVIKN